MAAEVHHSQQIILMAYRSSNQLHRFLTPFVEAVELEQTGDTIEFHYRDVQRSEVVCIFSLS